MKRYGHLFSQSFNEFNLYLAYLDARRGKRNKRSCFEFECRLGAHLKELQAALHSYTYVPRPYHSFTVHEPKLRLIHAPAFIDTVVQHAIYRIIQPIFDRTFISTSFACRPGYGTHAASRYVQRAMRQVEPESYILKLDVRRFFYSIDRDILRNLIERKIKDRHLMDVTMKFAAMDTPLGIPIGNLLSQLYALIYLNPVDHFIKRQLKVRRYARYVDDMVLIGLGRDACLQYRHQIALFLRDKLGLELSKSTIQRVCKGCNFVGYRTWRNKRFIRKYSLYKFVRCARRGRQHSIVSLLGHAQGTDSVPYMIHCLQRENPKLMSKIPVKYRRFQWD